MHQLSLFYDVLNTLARMEKKKKKPSSELSERTLKRKLYFHFAAASAPTNRAKKAAEETIFCSSVSKRDDRCFDRPAQA